jgi:hypothetical protein
VTRDKGTVCGDHQIRLDKVSTHLSREPVTLERVLGPMAARPTMADDNGLLGRHDCSSSYYPGQHHLRAYHCSLTPSRRQV